MKSSDLQQFINKAKKMEKGHQMDLSSGEDLSVAIMNLIGIEEHMFFTSQKLGETKYIEVLNTAREMRKELMKKIVKEGARGRLNFYEQQRHSKIYCQNKKT